MLLEVLLAQLVDLHGVLALYHGELNVVVHISLILGLFFLGHLLNLTGPLATVSVFM